MQKYLSINEQKTCKETVKFQNSDNEFCGNIKYFDQDSKQLKDVSKQFKDITDDIETIKEDVETNRTDIESIKVDVSNIYEDIGNIKEDISDVKEDIGNIKEDIGQVQDEVNKLNDVVPSEASKDNKLVDRKTLEHEIEVADATFRGTYDSEDQLPTEGVDKNDYAFVIQQDEDKKIYKKYKWTILDDESWGWKWEYDIDTSSGIGRVKTVNGIEPDENGNVELPIDSKINEESTNPVQNKVIAEALKSAGKVKTVNGIEPIDGNIDLPMEIDSSKSSISLFKVKDIGVDGLVYDIVIEGGIVKANAKVNTIDCTNVNVNEIFTENLSVTDK